jgi:hypothetical protein
MVEIVLPRNAGPAGVGVPAGGTSGQVLAKTSGADYATAWVDQTGGDSPPWAISDTTGLQAALDAKAPNSGATLTSASVNGVTLSVSSGTSVFLRGDGTYATPPGGGGGGGDVYGPASSVVDQFATYADTTGKLLKAVSPTKALVGLGNVDNTSDANKPVSTAQATAILDAKPIEAFGFALSDTTTAITTGTAKLTVRMPYAFTLLSGAAGVRASLSTASSSGIPTVDINENGTTILSTKLTIDATEKTSTTAAVPAVISDTSLADDAEITFDIDVAGTGAVGLVVWLIGRRT